MNRNRWIVFISIVILVAVAGFNVHRPHRRVLPIATWTLPKEAHSVAITSDGGIAAFGGTYLDGTVTLRRTLDGTIVAKLGKVASGEEPVTDVRFSPDNQTLLVTADQLFMWDLSAIPRLIKKLGIEEFGCPPVFHPTGKFIAVNDSLGHISIIDRTGREITNLKLPDINPDYMAFVGDRYLAVTGNPSSAGCQVFDWRAGKRIVALPFSGSLIAIGKNLLVIGSPLASFSQSQIIWYDLDKRVEVKRTTLNMTISSFISADEEKLCFIALANDWQSTSVTVLLRTGNLATLQSSRGWIRAASDNSGRVISVSKDSTVRLWKL